MEKATLISIAERTGVSVSTISRVLNGKAEKYRISPQTVERVREEASRCNYIPNINAQSLRTNRTRTIGLIVPAIDNPFFANIASSIIQKAKEARYTVVLADSMENEANERENIASLLTRNVDGIILSPSGSDPKYLEEINDNKIPVVLVDRFFDDTTLPYVITDNYRGAREATEHLIANGHERIACIQGTPHSSVVNERLRGYCDAMRSAGLEEHIRHTGSDFSIRNGYIETKLLLTRRNPPSAIFTMSNTILLGAIKAVDESQLTVPDDLSIVSFDDNTYLDFMRPAISRIVQPLDEIGAIALKILLQSIEEKNRSDSRVILPPRFKICASVKKYGRQRSASPSER